RRQRAELPPRRQRRFPHRLHRHRRGNKASQGFVAPLANRLTHLRERSKLRPTRITLIHVRPKLARFAFRCFTIKHADKIAGPFASQGIFHSVHPAPAQTTSLPNFCNRNCNCFNPVYSRLFTVLSGTSSASAISRNVRSSNSFITTTCRNSSGNPFNARRTANVFCRPSVTLAGD